MRYYSKILKFSVALLMTSTLSARENPFESLVGANKIEEVGISTNVADIVEPYNGSSVNLPSSARVLRSIDFIYQNLDGSIAKKSVLVEKGVDWHEPLIVTHNKKKKLPEAKQQIKEEQKLLASFGFIRFEKQGTDLRVISNDDMQRHFLLVNPHRIVIDFKRDASFATKHFEIKKSAPFRNIHIGNHDGYYRVVIELDGQYRYKLKHDVDALRFSFY